MPRAADRAAAECTQTALHATMTEQAVIELWLVDLDSCAEALELAERDVPRLSMDDRERAQALADPIERRRRLAAYTALRMLIERVASPSVRGEPFVRGAGSKPRLASGRAGFNVSHADRHALIAVSRASDRFGVDLERIRPASMAPQRQAEIVAAGKGLGSKPLSGLGAERTFIQAWARLEAFAKARGAGLARTLADLGLRGKGTAQALPPARVEAAAHHLAAQEGVAVSDMRLLAGFLGAVAAPRGVPVRRVAIFPAQRAAIDGLLLRRP